MAKVQIDVDAILADEMAAPADSKKKASKRPRTGERLADEPAPTEVLKAALNLPRPEFPVELGGYQTRLVDLNFLQSRHYLEALLPAIERAVKEFIPVINSLQSCWFFLMNFNSENVETLRETIIYETANEQVLLETLQNWGVPGANPGHVAALKAAAENPVRFNNHLSWLFMTPLVDALSQIDIAKLILSIADTLPDLAAASLSAGLKAEGAEGDLSQPHIKAEIMERADAFDMLNVALKQIELYKVSGKLANFTGPIRSLIGLAMS